MNKYTEPKIKRIRLDFEQAILEACQLGGAYFNAEGDCVRVVENPYVNYICYVGVKGRSSLKGMIPTGGSPNAQPS